VRGFIHDGESACCRVLQRVAVCCSVLTCDAVCAIPHDVFSVEKTVEGLKYDEAHVTNN